MSALGRVVVLHGGGMRLACKASSRRRDLGTFRGAYLVKRAIGVLVVPDQDGEVVRWGWR